MNYLVIENEKVVNIIVINAENVDWYEETFNCTLLQSNVLQIGDYKEDGIWYRDITILNEETQEFETVKTEIE